MARSKITIGDHRKIGTQATIIDSDQYRTDTEEVEKQPITIGKHVWIGARATILKGVTIGDNAV